MKKLSIITICYNESNLEKTCESIVNQTWQDFEWIVIDGGSNSATQEIWNKYKYRIDKFISEPDKGVYDAFNKGIKLASGEYLNFLNAGDYYVSSDVLNDIMRCNITEDIVYCDLKIISKNKFKIKSYPDIVDEEFLITSSLPHPSSFIRKELFEKYGYYNTGYRIVSDWEKWIIFIHVNKCSYRHVPYVCSCFNKNGVSSKNFRLNHKERKSVLKEHFSSKEINKARGMEYSLLEKIFSVRLNKTHVIITILGIHIKIKRSKDI